MTDNEIIKALEYCNADRNECNKCVLQEECESSPFYSSIAKHALGLINRQKAEIETLKKRISELKHARFKQQAYTAELQNEIVKLKDHNENLLAANTAFSNEILEAKSEAYKEFAERLKKEALPKCNWDDCIDVEDIDRLVKEMVGEEE